MPTTRISDAEMADIKVDVLNDLIASIASLPDFQESYTSADLALRIEDQGWVRLESKLTGEIDTATRKRTIELARIYYQREPLAKHVVRIWTDYAIGTEINFKCREAGVQAVIDMFWGNPLNRGLFSSQGIRKSSHRLLVDGEVFLALVGGPPDTIVRRIDPLEITRFLADPDDFERVLFFRRDYLDTARSQVQTNYYRSWQAIGDLPEVKDDGQIVNGREVPDIVIYPVLMDPYGNRGQSLLATVIDWLREHRRFMESRASITQALASFAWKLKKQGGTAAGMEALKSKVLAGVSAQGGGTQRPVGATWIENQALELSAMPRDTGATQAKGDSDIFKLMICAGSGVMLHYLGDPSTGNLATATAMELPMLKQFQAYQRIWTDTYRELFEYVSGVTGLEVDIDWPPIIEGDNAKNTEAISKVIAAIPATADLPEVQMQALLALGINDVQDVLPRLEQIKADREAKALELAQQAAKQPAMPIKPMATRESEALLDTLQGLREALYP